MKKAVAARSTGPAADRARMAGRLQTMLKRQLKALENEPVEGFSEERVKALLLLAKTLQAMEVAEPKPGKATDADTSDALDIVEFRALLEERISALVDGGAPQPVPVAADAA